MARQLTLEIAVEKARAQQELRELEQGLDNLTKAALKTGAATDKQKDAFDGLSKRAADAKEKIKSLGAEHDKTAKAADANTKSTGLLSAAVLRYASAGAVIAAVKWTADWADRLEELHKVTGLSITMLQKLDQVTKLNGTSVEALTRAFSTMQDRVAGGDKSAVRAFERLGVSFDAFQRMRPDDQMENLAIAVMKIEDPMERANVVTDLFGRTGVQLIPTLEKIAGGMDDITVASEKNVKALGQLSDWWETLKGQGAILLVDVLGPMVTMWQNLALGTEGFAGRIDALVTAFSKINPALNVFVAKAKEYVGLLGGKGMPKVPDAPTLDQPSGNGLGFDPFDPDQVAERVKSLSAVVDAQIASDGARRRSARETAEEIERAAQRELNAYNAVLEMHQRAFRAATGGYDDAIYGRGTLMYRQSNVYLPTNPNLGPGMTTSAMPNVQGTDMSSLRQRPGFWRRQMGDISGMQAQWRAYNFGSAEGWMNSAYGWGSQLQEISETGDPLVNATNVRGRGKRALAGALKGAEVGGRFGGPYGAMGGALVGLIVGAFRNPAFEDVWNRIAKNFGVEVSDELAKSIADRAKKEFGNDRQAAEIASLSSIISEGGGLDADNIDKMTARFRDAFSMKETGKFDQKQLETMFNENFGTFADYTLSTGEMATDQFVELIRLAKEFNVESEPLRQFIGGEAAKIGDGLATMLTPVLDTAIQVGSRVEEAQGRMTYLMQSGKGDTEEYRLAALELQEAIRHQGEVAQLAAGDLENIGTIALATFNNARANGLSFAEAIDAIGPSLDALALAQKGFGIESDNAALKQLMHYKELTDQHRPLVEAAGALNDTMLALSNIGGINAETLAAMEDQGMRTFNRLIDAGFSENEALMQMGDFLGNIRDSHEKLGIPIDANTQHLIDQAEAQGILKTKAKDTNDILMEGLGAIIDAVGGKIPAAWDIAARAAKDAAKRSADDAQAEFDRVNPTYKVEYDYPDEGPRGPNGNPEGYSRGGYVRPRYAAMGMFVPRGTDTVPAMLTPGEGVLSHRGMRALGRLNAGGDLGGYSITINVQGGGDPDETAQKVSDALERVLRTRGIKQRSLV